MQTKYKVIIVVVSLLTSFAVGRFSAPTKTVTQTKTVTNTETDSNTDKHQVTTQHEVIQPNGTTIIDTVTKDDTVKQVDTSTSSETDQTKTVTKDGKRINLSLLAGENINTLGAPIFGGHVSTNLIGPITVGIWGLSNGTGGCSVGLSL